MTLVRVPRAVRVLVAPLLAGISVVVLGCSQTPVTQPLRSLERSGNVSFVCVGPDGQGRDINDCPDYASGQNRLLALVTQTLRGEVAVVDLTAGHVVDVDRSTPGYNFLPIGANPVSIVSTPGGVATFVGVAEAGKEGIYALPSSCAGAPRKKADGSYEHVRDLTSWPACKLPVAPGSMAILVDPAKDDDGDPATPPRQRASCASPYTDDAGTPGQALAATRSECAADLALETNPPGRRKLAVALPKLGEIAIIDAQQLLDRPPGSFGTCPVERILQPAVDLPASDIKQPLPPDLQQAGCSPPELNYGPPSQSYLPSPAGFALSNKQLYVADRGAPVVHVFDVSDPCNINEQPPLLPLSFDSPGRVVTTSRVAVSPLTTDGKRFAYAIDETQGSVMIFDVSPGSADRTPIVRPGAPWLPFEAPDRLAFSSPARDVTFALRDVPIADSNGVAQIGTACDPDPSISPDSVAARYRTSRDLSSGASPRKLRGVFGFVMLASGQIAVIDEDDFDARCRRPVEANHEATADFRGCLDDPSNIKSYSGTSGNTVIPTVSDEVSCNVVERHRTRSANFVLADSSTGVRAPSLRSFPRLHTPEGSEPTTGTPPMLLGVDFGPSQPAQVFVGGNYLKRGDTDNPLDVDPGSATEDSLVLPFNEPRAYASKEDFSLTFEGPIMGDRRTGLISLSSADFSDPGAYFCDRGVRDFDATRTFAQTKLGVSSDLDRFASQHADYVQLESGIPGKDSSYWKTPAAESCGGASNGHYNCLSAFGPSDAPTVLRDLRIREAYVDHLVVEPRSSTVSMATVRCCFPAQQKYTIRAGDQWVLIGSASGFRHHMTTDSNGRCVADCNPRRALLQGRAFEIATKSQVASCNPKLDPIDCPKVGCVAESVPVASDNACVFSSLSARFAVYRGSSPSERDMSFTWTTTGGFSPLVANLASQTTSVLPQSMQFIPQIGQLAIADGAAEGLALVSLDSVSVSHLYY